MDWKFWKKKPTAIEVVERVLSELVTQEQLDKLSALYQFDGMNAKEEILDSARHGKTRYSMKKSLEIAKFEIKYLSLDNPSVDTRMMLRHLFTRKLLRG